MTLSQKFKFEFLRRRALFVTNDRAQVFHWNGGELEGNYSFDTTDQGLALFEDYLHVNNEEPVYILVDIADEEFRLDTVPHVMGSDRKALLQRKQNKLFRNIKYSYSEVQGRETHGRRDDRVLFSSITEDDAIQPWLYRLNQNKVPIAGIYSVAHMARYLLDSVGHANGPALVVNLQRNAGLRQSFFLNKEFKFSRLVKMPRYGTESYEPIMREEVNKMLRYLRSMRFLTNENQVQVYILGDSPLHQELKLNLTDSAGVKFNFVDLDELANSIGLRFDFVDPFSEVLYVYLLLKKKPGNIYATDHERRYFQLRNIRNSLLGSSILILLGTLLWTGFSFIEAVTLKQQSISALSKSKFYQERYELARERLPQLPVEPRDLETTVNVAESIATHKASPLSLMQILSMGLRDYTDIQVERIKWMASEDPSATFEDYEHDSEPSSGSEIETSNYIYYQIANVNAYVSPFTGNYREVIGEINQMVERLRSLDNVYNVNILTMPLDISSASKLKGSADTRPDEAEFSIRLVVGVL